MKLSITLYSPIQACQLDEQIVFSKARVNKLTYITGHNENREIIIDIPVLNTDNTAYNTRQLHKYFFSLFLPPFPNYFIQYYQNGNIYDTVFQDEQYIKNFMIYCYKENGEFETSITLTNPLKIEIEFE